MMPAVSGPLAMADTCFTPGAHSSGLSHSIPSADRAVVQQRHAVIVSRSDGDHVAQTRWHIGLTIATPTPRGDRPSAALVCFRGDPHDIPAIRNVVTAA